MYGDVPIRLEVKQEARTLELRSDIVRQIGDDGELRLDRFKGNLDLSEVDIIEHHVFSADLELFREWVVLKPEVILRATADPKELRETLEKSLARLKNPSFQFSEAEIHHFIGGHSEETWWFPIMNDPERRIPFIEILERYLASPPEIAPIWRNWINGEACGSLLKRSRRISN